MGKINCLRGQKGEIARRVINYRKLAVPATQETAHNKQFKYDTKYCEIQNTNTNTNTTQNTVKYKIPKLDDSIFYKKYKNTRNRHTVHIINIRLSNAKFKKRK